MNIRRFLDDRYFSLLLNLFGSILLGLFLRFIGVTIEYLFLIFSVWWGVVLFYYGISYYYSRMRIVKLKKIMEALDQKNLFTEVAGKPISALETCYFDFVKVANLSMTEQISECRRNFEEYEDYIEQWIHDVKTPIAASQLIIENLEIPSVKAQELLSEIDVIEYYVEQALYYARSDQANKDYLIQEVSLSSVVHAGISKNQRQLIRNGFQVEVDVTDLSIALDKKWVIFIMTQIIKNSIQYKRTNPKIFIYSKMLSSGTSLTIRDNGVGISEEELPRVFDKGFTGKNGRDHHKASGIGLYLSKRLCDKLGLGITVDSMLGQFTEITIYFPQNRYF